MTISRWCAEEQHEMRVTPPPPNVPVDEDGWGVTYMSGHVLCVDQRWHDSEHLDCCASGDEIESWNCTCECHNDDDCCDEYGCVAVAGYDFMDCHCDLCETLALDWAVERARCPATSKRGLRCSLITGHPGVVHISAAESNETRFVLETKNWTNVAIEPPEHTNGRQ